MSPARITIGLASALLVFAAVGPLNAADIVGQYSCVGTNPTGGQYMGVVVIAKDAQRYSVKWTVGNESYAGIGLLEGDVLSVSWTVQGMPGVVVYKRAPGGKLNGRWTVQGLKGVFTERLTPRPKQ